MMQSGGGFVKGPMGAISSSTCQCLICKRDFLTLSLSFNKQVGGDKTLDRAGAKHDEADLIENWNKLYIFQ